jgi:hypothetical protein
MHTTAVVMTLIFAAVFVAAWLYGVGHFLLYWRFYRPWRDSLHARGLGPRFWSYPLTPSQWRRYIGAETRLFRKLPDPDHEAEVLRTGARSAFFRAFAAVFVSFVAAGAALAVHAFFL